MNAVAISLIAAPADRPAEHRAKPNEAGRDDFASALSGSERPSPERDHEAEPDASAHARPQAPVAEEPVRPEPCLDATTVDPTAVDPAVAAIAAALLALAAPSTTHAPTVATADAADAIVAPVAAGPNAGGIVVPAASMTTMSPAEALDAIAAVLSGTTRDAVDARPVTPTPADAAAAMLEAAPPALVAVAATKTTAEPARPENAPVDAAPMPVEHAVPAVASTLAGGSTQTGGQQQQQQQQQPQDQPDAHAAQQAPAAPATAIGSEAPGARVDAPANPVQAISGERATATVAATTDATAADRAVAQQVARAVANHGGVQGKPLILRLTPPELGTVRVEIVERAGQVTARIHAEDAAVRTAIERFLPQLKQDLRANDAPIRDVVLADAYQQQGQQERDRSQESGERGQRTARGSAFALDGVAPADDALPTSARALGGRVADDMVDARA